MASAFEATFFCDRDMRRAEVQPLGSGGVGVFSARCPVKDGANEDAAAIIPIDGGSGVLAIADGMGGGPAGEHAAAGAVRALADALAARSARNRPVREAILDGLEAANRTVLEAGVGAATTLAVAEIDGEMVRTYHVGDSGVLIVGQRGRVKYLTVAHSPTGYAVEAGLMDEEEAMSHDERHVVFNLVGSAEMKIEIGPTLHLAPRDTLLLATDGVFDNLRIEEIVAQVRVGPIRRALEGVAGSARRRMTSSERDPHGKPDDLTILLYRPTLHRGGA